MRARSLAHAARTEEAGDAIQLPVAQGQQLAAAYRDDAVVGLADLIRVNGALKAVLRARGQDHGLGGIGELGIADGDGALVAGR